MAAGFGLLRLSPRDLWSMTPRELAAALSVVLPLAAPPAPSYADITRLMRRFPDLPNPATTRDQPL
jgi:uncharacterized phage protein (TIGR02216 family)